MWYSQDPVPSTCQDLSLKRNASKVQDHVGIRENDVRMLSSRRQSDNRQAAPLCSLLGLAVLSLDNV